MSADAKIWQEDDGQWSGLHDDPCADPNLHRNQTCYGLNAVIESIELCMKTPLAWEFRTYPDGKVGLSGYIAARWPR